MTQNRDISSVGEDVLQLDEILSTSKARIKVVMIFMIMAFSILIMRILELNFTARENFKIAKKSTSSELFALRRLNIVDRNGVLVATNLSTASLYANPKELISPENVAQELSQIGSEWQYKEIYDKLTSNKSFVWLKRHLSPSEQQKIHNLGFPGLYFAADERRVYPQSALLSHVLGFVDIDGNGIAGVERYFNDHLSSNINTGKALELSLDLRIQSILKEELQNSIDTHNALGASGIVMDVNSGEVLAMVSLPDFDLHHVEKATEQQRFNQNTLAVHEMGSTLKLATVATGIDTGSIKINDAFDVSQPLKIAKFTINDYKGKGGALSVPEILIYSSNLGTAQIVEKFGQKHQRDYLRKFGVLSKVGFELPEVASPLYPQEKSWRDLSMITISYGHGIAITPLHVVQTVSAIANGGLLRKPTLIKGGNANEPEIRVLKQETSELMRKLMYLVVQYGSGRKAQVNGYYVGGKTGTGEKVSHGRYNKHANLASFVGVFPVYEPKYAVLILVDEAKANKVNFGYTTGGMIAAPVASAVIKRAAPILNVMPQLDDDSLSIIKAKLNVEFNPRYKELR